MLFLHQVPKVILVIKVLVDQCLGFAKELKVFSSSGLACDKDSFPVFLCLVTQLDYFGCSQDLDCSFYVIYICSVSSLTFNVQLEILFLPLRFCKFFIVVNTTCAVHACITTGIIVKLCICVEVFTFFILP